MATHHAIMCPVILTDNRSLEDVLKTMRHATSILFKRLANVSVLRIKNVIQSVSIISFTEIVCLYIIPFLPRDIHISHKSWSSVTAYKTYPNKLQRFSQVLLITLPQFNFLYAMSKKYVKKTSMMIPIGYHILPYECEHHSRLLYALVSTYEWHYT